MTRVFTADGPGVVTETDTRHGTTWFYIEGSAMSGWYPAREVTADIGDPGRNVTSPEDFPDPEDGTRLPYDPRPRDVFHNQLTIQPTSDLPPNLTPTDSINGLRYTEPNAVFGSTHPFGKEANARHFANADNGEYVDLGHDFDLDDDAPFNKEQIDATKDSPYPHVPKGWKDKPPGLDDYGPDYDKKNPQVVNPPDGDGPFKTSAAEDDWMSDLPKQPGAHGGPAPITPPPDPYQWEEQGDGKYPRQAGIDPSHITIPNYYFVESVSGQTYTDTADLNGAIDLADKLAASKGEDFKVISQRGTEYHTGAGRTFGSRQAAGTREEMELGLRGDCEACVGTGEIYAGEPCPVCRGTGNKSGQPDNQPPQTSWVPPNYQSSRTAEFTENRETGWNDKASEEFLDNPFERDDAGDGEDDFYREAGALDTLEHLWWGDDYEWLKGMGGEEDPKQAPRRPNQALDPNARDIAYAAIDGVNDDEGGNDFNDVMDPQVQQVPWDPSHGMTPGGDMQVFSPDMETNDADPAGQLQSILSDDPMEELAEEIVDHFQGTDDDLQGVEVPHQLDVDDEMAGMEVPHQGPMGPMDIGPGEVGAADNLADVGPTGNVPIGPHVNNDELAHMAQTFLARTSAKNYSDAEQAALMNEAGVAAQLPSLRLSDSIYEESDIMFTI